MTFIENRKEERPGFGEAPFELNEIFFSRTDSKGIIQAGNDTFRRVSGYEWEKLLGAPHKIIRHESMPRGVFKLFWDTIGNGDVIGAYVKNKARDGLYYWVFAVVVPCEEGFLSVRVKPSSDLFTTVQQGYAELLKSEQEDHLSPEQSRAKLIAWLRSLGFENYEQFAAYALAEELTAREIGLNKPLDSSFEKLRNLLSQADILVEETRGLVEDFTSMRTIPHNLRVLASRIEPAGGPVTVLSQNYGAISSEMSNWFAAHVLEDDSNFSKIKEKVSHSLFVEGMARVMTECNNQLQSERRSLGGVDLEQEQALLATLTETRVKHAQAELQEVDNETQNISKLCDAMLRQLLGLSSTRVLCKIEGARLAESGQALFDIIDQLGRFQERISSRLHRIIKLCAYDHVPRN